MPSYNRDVAPAKRCPSQSRSRISRSRRGSTSVFMQLGQMPWLNMVGVCSEM